uniref:Uncharacterized protein n=1 Tax=Arundo donax TaxID=35708 RepID=A0A0A9GAZ9_ARUDO
MFPPVALISCNASKMGLRGSLTKAFHIASSSSRPSPVGSIRSSGLTTWTRDRKGERRISAILSLACPSGSGGYRHWRVSTSIWSSRRRRENA